MSEILLTSTEAAARAGVHSLTLKREARRGRLSMIRIGGNGRALFRSTEIDAWAAARTRKAYTRRRRTGDALVA